MPLVYQQNINQHSRLGLWHITEPESFFLQEVPLQRSITHPHKRLQHLAGRRLLRELFPDFPYNLIRIADTRKPFLENEAYHFSISHCGDYAAVLVSRTERVGVDVEAETWRTEKVKHRFLLPNEIQLIETVAAEKNIVPVQLFTLAWSIKEALYKWYGSGEIDFKEHLRIHTLQVQDNGGTAACQVLKQHAVALQVHFLFIGGNCISWVKSS
ncbi:MAG TPA: 4'-phosphopantetheinyl transferase superfamily protein [Ferruginibacter sp.]|nr:4'-phosphopantetheinyl transferase superfamily protein [Ferruginibacter sp.]HMP22201.1 4'-phosphopantetheinyl transferase superfamily protein [Ferruginibacter sp.]